jgi:hypothetical protein
MTIRTDFNAIALGAVIVAGLASPALADEIIELHQYDLTRVEDVDRLHLDIVQAATRGCNEEFRRWNYGSRGNYITGCIRYTVDNAVVQAQNLGLSNLHASINADHRYDDARGPTNTISASTD